MKGGGQSNTQSQRESPALGRGRNPVSIVRQATPALPAPKTSQYWHALRELGIDPDPEFELGGQITPGGGGTGGIDCDDPNWANHPYCKETTEPPIPPRCDDPDYCTANPEICGQNCQGHNCQEADCNSGAGYNKDLDCCRNQQCPTGYHHDWDTHPDGTCIPDDGPRSCQAEGPNKGIDMEVLRTRCLQMGQGWALDETSCECVESVDPPRGGCKNANGEDVECPPACKGPTGKQIGINPDGSPKCGEHTGTNGSIGECRERPAHGNTCGSNGWGSADPPQYEWRPAQNEAGGFCVEVGCNYDENPADEFDVKRPSMNPFVLGMNPDGTPKRCGDGSFPFENPTGRCPEDPDAPITGGGQGDPDTGSPPIGSYTGVGPEGEDQCSNPAYAIINPTICGPQGTTDRRDGGPDYAKQRQDCDNRGGFWNIHANTNLDKYGQRTHTEGKGVCVDRNIGSAQKPCADGSYPRDHEGGVCPVRRRTHPGSGPNLNPADIPAGPGYESGMGY